MAETTAIEWADATVNMWWGCTKVSPGCANCYAEAWANRWGKDVWGPGKPREDHRAGATKLARKLNRKAQSTGEKIRVFSASQSDWLDPEVDPAWLADLLALIAETPALTWMLLTKRPQLWEERIAAAVSATVLGGTAKGRECPMQRWLNGQSPDNVWVGATTEDQQRADERIPALLAIPARVRFLSCEPLLGPLDLGRPKWLDPSGLVVPGLPVYREADMVTIHHGGPSYQRAGRGWQRIGQPPRIHWIICGGESGPGARPMHPQWARSLRDQAQAAGVSFFMKQLGGARDKRSALEDMPEDLRLREVPHAHG